MATVFAARHRKPETEPRKRLQSIRYHLGGLFGEPELLVHLEVIVNGRGYLGVVNPVQVNDEVALLVEDIECDFANVVGYEEQWVLANQLDIDVVQSCSVIAILHMAVLRALWTDSHCQWQTQSICQDGLE